MVRSTCRITRPAKVREETPNEGTGSSHPTIDAGGSTLDGPREDLETGENGHG